METHESEMERAVSRLLTFATYRAINTDDYTFVLLESPASTAEAWEHQRRALATMDDPVRQSTRIQKVDDVFYWIGQDGYPTAMWVPKQRPAIAPNPPRTPQPLQAPRVTRLHEWSEAKLDAVPPFHKVNGAWKAYTPNPTTIYAIIPGLNRIGHLMHRQDGANFNVVLQRWDPSYDHYAFRNPNGKNLRKSSAHVFADIVEMIRRRNGPAAIVCGSRGGQETMLELTKYWRGLVFDFNGGFLEGCQREFKQIPDGIHVVSVLGRLDFFNFNNNRNVRTDSEFRQFVQRKLDFLTLCVGNQKSGQHILYASDIIDHGLDDLDGRNLILAVMQGRNGMIRAEDFVYRVG